MVDRPKLDQMLTSLRNYVAELRQLAAVPRSDFLANKDKIGNAKYQFIAAIECGVDVANHITASEGFRIPKDNADSFLVLVEQGWLPCEKRESFAAMARFRNRLVHLYWGVDNERVYDYLQNSLADLDAFVTAVASRGTET
ncbi:MAG: hypothetical protein A3K19_03745 [Lentisphaerae bacterium RIFOXYB12_FULL_65_16]|nr:MAG: hypothetical protein A3K18_03120 [Lentisphaerae bacterium RIFOXYA12_64_32]OGV89257.1 MAG: hypothetical protein A3K19_03745 [Lentisphaerae bacterium RIFOXYB12_FULL_65_16]